jgi:integrative and conjugative element protein (TIGR02256 family)
MSNLQGVTGRCFLPNILVDEMLTEADKQSPLETGGVLLGVSDSENVWVDAILGPGPRAKHTVTGFEPDSEYHVEQIAGAYERANRRISYLGDWHTHPKVSPAISRKDRRTLRAIAKDASARQPKPVMLIFGYGDPWKGIAWRYAGAAWWGLSSNATRLELVIT